MKIIIEGEGIKSEITGNAVEMQEVMELIKQALLGYGFHPDTVKEYTELEEK